MSSAHSVDIYGPLREASSLFILNAGERGLSISLRSLSLHLGSRLKLPDDVHQFLFTFGLKEGRNDAVIQYFGFPFQGGRTEKPADTLRRIAGLIEHQLVRWYDTPVLRETFDEYFDNDCQSRWTSDVASNKSVRSRVEVLLAPFSAKGELEIVIDKVESRYLLFQAIPPSQAWAALLGSLHVKPKSVCVQSVRGGLIATDGGPIWMGKGKVARRFVVSIDCVPPRVSQCWELTRQALRDPLPSVLSQFYP